MKKLLIAFLLISGFFVQAQENRHYLYDPYYETASVNIELIHTDAYLNIDPYKETVEGLVKMSFKTINFTTDSIVFDCPDMDIKKLTIDGKETKYENNNGTVIISPQTSLGFKTTHNIEFGYISTHPRGLYFIGWNDTKNIKRKQIWAHRPNSWLPYYSSFHTIDYYITFDKNYKVFANGVLVDIKDNGNGTNTTHYNMEKPHPYFSTSLVIGDYESKKFQTASGLPLEYWYYAGEKEKFDYTYKYSVDMFDFLESEFGFKYPYPLYKQAPVIDYMYGAMETTTATIFTDICSVDSREFLDRNYININCHELVHQWFGDCIAHLKAADCWITESFATYFAKKFMQNIYDEDVYQAERLSERTRVLGDPDDFKFPIIHGQAGVNRLYPKGSLVMDMLRDVLGEEDFKAVIKFYLEQNSYNYAETTDFFSAVRKVTGKSPFWFYDQWLLHAGEPNYKVSYESLKSETRIYIEQIQEQSDLIGLFKMPVVIEVHYKDGSIDAKNVIIENKNHIVTINNKDNKIVSFVIFDPNDKILKKLNFKRSYEELAGQAEFAGNMIDRYDALTALNDTEIGKKRDLLGRLYDRETFYLTKSEIIKQLSGDNDKKSTAVLKKAIADSEVKLRMAVLSNNTKVPVDLKKEFEKCLKDSSYANINSALISLVETFPNEADKYLKMTEKEIGYPGKNIRITWLEKSIITGKKQFIPELIEYSSLSYEFKTRINAFESLVRLNYFDPKVAEYAFEAAVHWNFKLSGSGLETLKYFYKQQIYKDIINKELENSKYTKENVKKIKDYLI